MTGHFTNHPFLATFCALSLSSCYQDTSSPSTANTLPSGTAIQSPSTSVPTATVLPSPTPIIHSSETPVIPVLTSHNPAKEDIEITELVLKIQADPSLFDFQLLASDPIGLCLNQIHQAQMTLYTPKLLAANQIKSLQSEGYLVTGPLNGKFTLKKTIDLTSQMLSRGFEISTRSNLGRVVDFEVSFLNAQGQNLGGFQGNTSSFGTSRKQVDIKLTPVKNQPQSTNCPLINVDVSGAQLSGTKPPLVPHLNVQAAVILLSDKQVIDLSFIALANHPDYRVYANDSLVASLYSHSADQTVAYRLENIRNQTDYLIRIESALDAGLNGSTTVRSLTVNANNDGGSSGSNPSPSPSVFEPSPTPSPSVLYTSGFLNKSAATAIREDGEYIVLYNSPDGNSLGVFGQRYDSLGSTIGDEFKINTTTSGYQGSPKVAMNESGNFVALWEGNGIYAQRYSSDATAIGSEFKVNSYTSSNSPSSADIALNEAGEFVITWRTSEQDGSAAGVFAQRYVSSGSALGSEFQVNTTTLNNQTSPSVAIANNGNFVVTWTDLQIGHSEVYAQLYNSLGAQMGSEFRVNTYTTDYQSSSRVAMDSDGDFVICWLSQTQNESFDGIYAQRYNHQGTAQGSEFQIHTITTAHQRSPQIVSHPDGDFIVSWTDGSYVYLRHFDAEGNALTQERAILDLSQFGISAAQTYGTYAANSVAMNSHKQITIIAHLFIPI